MRSSIIGVWLLYIAQLVVASCNHDNCLRAVIASAFPTRSGSADCASYFLTTVETNIAGQTVEVIPPTNIPAYATACSGSVRYSSACSCVGATPVITAIPAPSPTCAAGTLSCNGAPCQDVLSDPNNCGTCGNVCPSGVCQNGQCSAPTCNGSSCGSLNSCGSNCFCFEDSSNTGFCGPNILCGPLAGCTSSFECLPGEVCATSTCCGRNVCLGSCANGARRSLFGRDSSGGYTGGSPPV